MIIGHFFYKKINIYTALGSADVRVELSLRRPRECPSQAPNKDRSRWTYNWLKNIYHWTPHVQDDDGYLKPKNKWVKYIKFFYTTEFNWLSIDWVVPCDGKIQFFHHCVIPV